MEMITISSRADIENYVDDAHPDFIEDGLGDELADAIQTADHPDYGRDWAEWLGENIGALRYAASGTEEQEREYARTCSHA